MSSSSGISVCIGTFGRISVDYFDDVPKYYILKFSELPSFSVHSVDFFANFYNITKVY